MDGEYRQKINIELTESEADCLLNWVLSMEKEVMNSQHWDVSEMVAMIFARIVGAFPSLMQGDNVESFMGKYGNGSEMIPNDRALIPRHRVAHHIEHELKNQKRNMEAELAKLDERETFLESMCIKRVLEDESRYTTERKRFSSVGQRLGSDVSYQMVKERKRKIKAELARIADEIASLSRNLQDNPVESLAAI